MILVFPWTLYRDTKSSLILCFQNNRKNTVDGKLDTKETNIHSFIKAE